MLYTNRVNYRKADDKQIRRENSRQIAKEKSSDV